MKIFYGRRDQECNDGIGCSGTFPVSGSLGLYHQNICGLRSKVNHDLPHLICISEHHLNNVEMDYIHLPNYKLGAKYCRTSSLKGGVCIFIHNNIKFQVIKLDLFCRDKDIEVCAVKLQLTNINTYVLMVYRAPSGNLDYFLNKLDIILKTLLHPNFEYMMSPHIVQVKKKAAQRLGLLSSLLHRRSGLSIRNGVLLYKQLIRPMMDYACWVKFQAGCQPRNCIAGWKSTRV